MISVHKNEDLLTFRCFLFSKKNLFANTHVSAEIYLENWSPSFENSVTSSLIPIGGCNIEVVYRQFFSLHPTSFSTPLYGTNMQNGPTLLYHPNFATVRPPALKIK